MLFYDPTRVQESASQVSRGIPHSHITLHRLGSRHNFLASRTLTRMIV